MFQVSDFGRGRFYTVDSIPLLIMEWFRSSVSSWVNFSNLCSFYILFHLICIFKMYCHNIPPPLSHLWKQVSPSGPGEAGVGQWWAFYLLPPMMMAIPIPTWVASCGLTSQTRREPLIRDRIGEVGDPNICMFEILHNLKILKNKRMIKG